ncbi:MAG: Dabb family protein [Chloroflexota bacterium]
MPDLAEAQGALLRHIVLLAFKQGTAPSQIREIERAFADLPGQIDEIYDFEWGVDISVEQLSQGYSHCFLVTFLSEADRNTYLPHPAHQAFVAKLEAHLNKALVIDYWTRR